MHQGAWGFYSISSPQNKDQIKNAINQAKDSAAFSAQKKKHKVILQDNPAYVENITYPVIQEPNLDDLVKIGKKCDESMSQKRNINLLCEFF